MRFVLPRLAAALAICFFASSSGAQSRRTAAPKAKPAEPLVFPDSAPDGLYAGTWKREYDRFRDATATVAFVTVGPVKSPLGYVRNVWVSAAYTTPGDSVSLPTTVSLMLTTRTRDWQYLKCRGVAALLDGKPFALPAATYDGQVRQDGVSETFTLTLPLSQFLRIANAQRFEGKICLDEFMVTGGDLLTFREMAFRMKPRP